MRLGLGYVFGKWAYNAGMLTPTPDDGNPYQSPHSDCGHPPFRVQRLAARVVSLIAVIGVAVSLYSLYEGEFAESLAGAWASTAAIFASRFLYTERWRWLGCAFGATAISGGVFIFAMRAG